VTTSRLKSISIIGLIPAPLRYQPVFSSSALCDEIVTKIPLAGLSVMNDVRSHDSEHCFIKIERQA